MTTFAHALSTQGQDGEKWRTLVDNHPGADIFFTRDYVQLFELSVGETGKEFGGEARLFHYGDDADYIAYPFFKRKVSNLPFADLLPPESRDWCDIASPYGYSGPLACIRNQDREQALWKGFLDHFHSFCLRNNIIAEFARLHPYLNNHIPLREHPGSCVSSRPPVIYVDLQQNENSLKKQMTKGNKSSISKAARSGVEIYISTAGEEDRAAFYRLYTATMQRNHARPSYYFSEEFISTAFKLLGDKLKLFCARHGSKIIAASLFLCKHPFVHYFLSGSDEEDLNLCPNNLLLNQSILWAKKEGYKLFNLGGGYTAHDSLFRFKSSFSRSTAEFYIYTRVHNEPAYQVLCKTQDKYITLHSKETGESTYFPKYRG